MLLQPILGWLVTLNPAGYHHAQKRTVPFLLLTKTLKDLFVNPGSSFLSNYYASIQRTCLEIIRDEEFDQQQMKIEESQGKSFKNEFVSQFSNACTHGLACFDSDSIPNLNIFTAKLDLVSDMGWVKF